MAGVHIQAPNLRKYGELHIQSDLDMDPGDTRDPNTTILKISLLTSKVILSLIKIHSALVSTNKTQEVFLVVKLCV